jgi:hypothetical protein
MFMIVIIIKQFCYFKQFVSRNPVHISGILLSLRRFLNPLKPSGKYYVPCALISPFCRPIYGVYMTFKS